MSKDAAECGTLINELAKHALVFQNPEANGTPEMVELLMELTKLHPRVVDASIQEFERVGVNFVKFFFCTETPSNLDVLISNDEDTCRNRCSIFSYASEALDKGIATGEVKIERVDPTKLVHLWNPRVLRHPMLSEDAIKAYVSSKLGILKAGDISNLYPQLVKILVTTALSASRDSIFMTEEVEHLAGLVDQVMKHKAESLTSSRITKQEFKELAECVPLNMRESHDSLYDAVASFSEWFMQGEVEDIWKMVDPEKLAREKCDDAINFALSYTDNFWARLLRRRQDDHLSETKTLCCKLDSVDSASAA